MDDAHPLDPRLLDQLPALPGIAAEFLQLCDDPSAGVADAAAVAERDPALLARILQAANSPFYSPREPVVDAARAGSILGLRSLTLIGVGFAILGDLWSTATRTEPLSALMGASAMAGSAARTFATTVDAGGEYEAVSTAGLLAFVGELALLRCDPNAFQGLWDRHGRVPSVEEQHTRLGTDGVQIGSLLMDRWGLPEELSDGVRIRQLSFEERMAQNIGGPAASLGFGTAIAEMLTAGQDALEVVREPARAWGIDDQELLSFWGDFRMAAGEAVTQLGLDIGSEVGTLITDAKDAYLASPLVLESELDSARKEIENLRQENDRLEGLSLQDPLTGAPNRPAFVTHLRSGLAQMVRDPRARRVGVAMFDIDYFKRVNDTHGHLTGDQLLSAVASAGLRAARANELFARIGGDEFAMILRPTDEHELALAIERVRQAMQAGAGKEGGVRGTTISAGGALLERVDGDIDAAARLVTQAADDALYAAKRAGRARTSVGTVVGGALSVAALS